ncbi:MAG: hypothetical protein ABSF34_10510, partial [Verrucomicrobiota bacterium]
GPGAIGRAARLFPDDLMNLPNYFFADLPPEAVLSPAMMAESCQTLKRNRAKFLAGRTTDDIIKLLCEVAAGWLSPEDKFRKLALDLGPAETGFSKPILERGLDGFFKSEPSGDGARAGVFGSHRGGQPAQSRFDEHYAGPVDALGAVREMRE